MRVLPRKERVKPVVNVIRGQSGNVYGIQNITMVDRHLVRLREFRTNPQQMRWWDIFDADIDTLLEARMDLMRVEEE